MQSERRSPLQIPVQFSLKKLTIRDLRQRAIGVWILADALDSKQFSFAAVSRLTNNLGEFVEADHGRSLDFAVAGCNGAVLFFRVINARLIKCLISLLPTWRNRKTR